MPRNKRTALNSGLHVPMLVHILNLLGVTTGR